MRDLGWHIAGKANTLRNENPEWHLLFTACCGSGTHLDKQDLSVNWVVYFIRNSIARVGVMKAMSFDSFIKDISVFTNVAVSYVESQSVLKDVTQLRYGHYLGKDPTPSH